ncbi:MAG TPA: hypothetical protein VND93_19955 [Myxococcales bacterium]|nr:hypothetical protein [Myxococcales bacterium]
MPGKGSGPHPGPGAASGEKQQPRPATPAAPAQEAQWPPYFREGARPTAAAPRPEPEPELAEADRVPTQELAASAQPTARRRLGETTDALSTDELPAVSDADSVPTRVLVTDPHRTWSEDALDREASMLALHLTAYELMYLAARVGVDWRSLGDPDTGKAEKCGRLLAWADEAGQRGALLHLARKVDPRPWQTYDANPAFPARVRPPRRSLQASDDARRVARLLSAHYAVDDLRDLTAPLLQRRGVDWDDLGAAGVGKCERIHGLVAYAEKEGFLHALMAAARELDPDPWVQFDADPLYPPGVEMPTRADAPSRPARRAAAVLSRHFDEEELRLLSEDLLDGLGVDWDDFGGAAVGRSERALRLLCWAEHVGIFGEALDVGRQHKPGAWVEHDEDPEAGAGPRPLPVEHPALEDGDLRIANALTSRFSRAQLKALAFEVFHPALGLDWTDFGGPGTIKSEWVERVVWYAREVGLLSVLLSRARDRQGPR